MTTRIVVDGFHYPPGHPILEAVIAIKALELDTPRWRRSTIDLNGSLVLTGGVSAMACEVYERHALNDRGLGDPCAIIDGEYWYDPLPEAE